MNKTTKYALIAAAGLAAVFVAKMGYEQVEIKLREQKLQALQDEASLLAAQSDYLGAAEAYKELTSSPALKDEDSKSNG